ELSLLPRVTSGVALVAAIVLVASLIVVERRRRAAAMPELPDFLGATVGVSMFTLAIDVFRIESENGSMAAFVLIVFVALASVRIGRSVGARIEASSRRASDAAVDRSRVIVSSVLLVAPLVLLAPLMVIDMGLFLVVVIPVGFATLLAAGRR